VPSNAPELKAQDCCERVQSKHQKAAASLSDTGPRTSVPVLAYVAPLDLSVEAPFVHLDPMEPRQARAPPPPPLKLFLKHCSLLTWALPESPSGAAARGRDPSCARDGDVRAARSRCSPDLSCPQEGSSNEAVSFHVGF